MLCGGGNSLHFFMKYLVGLATTVSSRVISTEDLGDDIRLFSLDFCMQWLLRLSLYHSDQHNPKLLKMPAFSEPPAAPKADAPSTWGHSCPLPSQTCRMYPLKLCWKAAPCAPLFMGCSAGILLRVTQQGFKVLGSLVLFK